MANNIIIDKKYISIISPQLELFEWKDSISATCRCPICGDSVKNKFKRRGHFYTYKNTYFYKCYNCDAVLPFWLFLKNNFPREYNAYKLDGLKNKKSNISGLMSLPEKKSTKIAIPKKDKYNNAVYVIQLSDIHPVKQYCQNRKISKKHLKDIVLYTDNFEKFVIEDLGLVRYKDKIPKKPRLIFLMKDQNNDIIGLQGRIIFEESTNKYITIKISDNSPKIFGLDKIDFNKPIIIVEGIIDSLFLPNCLAIIGGEFPMSTLLELNIKPENSYVIYDNEPRHKDTVKRMEKVIDYGFNVVFLNIDTKFKDINSMIINGISRKEILNNIIRNSYKKLKAKLELSQWSKIKKYDKKNKNRFT